jgi:hypothetical protein
MHGVNADGWLAAHHVAHRELIERADRAARRPVANPAKRAVPAVAGSVPAPAGSVPVCC